MDRRGFLAGAALLAACGTDGQAPVAPTASIRVPRRGDGLPGPLDQRILVLVELQGGNDGLNTVIPFGDDAYFRARPTLAIRKPKVLPLQGGFGLHPELTGLKSLHDDGHLAIVHGVGYPNPYRTHFRSTEIWQTASDSNKTERHGWLGRYFDSCCEGADPAIGISIGSPQSPQAFAAEKRRGISFANPSQFRFDLRKSSDPDAAEEFFRSVNEMDHEMQGGSIGMLDGPADMEGDTLDFLQRTALDATVSSDKILETVAKTKPPAAYPPGKLADSLNLVARLIAGGMPTRVYYVSQGGYDTHSKQEGSHARLMGELGAALSAFTADLKAQGNFDRVLTMTFSEFGRRVAENASQGTDHGAAAPMFLLGGKIQPGLHGQAPSLEKLDRGDLIHTVDFRNIYATILENWLQAPVEPILHRRFSKMGFI